MPDYRVYFFDGHGHIDRRQDLAMDNDVAAIGFVESLQARVARELWCGERKVRQWAAVKVNGAAVSSRQSSVIAKRQPLGRKQK